MSISNLTSLPTLAPQALPASTAATWRDFFALTKPRVMVLVVFTALCGLLAAPVAVHPVLGFTAILAITLGAGGSAVFNQWYEADIDSKMRRTAARPIPTGRVSRDAALQFGAMLSGFSVMLMALAINWLSAAILAFAIFFYAVIYTMWLKPATPQNIVIGGAAGAFPPMIGWTAATNELTALPILLFALIFVWTPPHFWALSLFVKSDYAKAGIPMMPVVVGIAATRRQIVAYSILLFGVAVAPFAMGQTGAAYGLTAIVLSGIFLALAIRVGLSKQTDPAKMAAEKKLFAFSILYLFVLFGSLVCDRLMASAGLL